jgi:hypothetical protein
MLITMHEVHSARGMHVAQHGSIKVLVQLAKPLSAPVALRAELFALLLQAVVKEHSHLNSQCTTT